MFAIVETGGKQYRVAKDDRLQVEKLDSEVGDTVTLDKVLLLGEGDSITVGTPLVDGAEVQAEVLCHRKAKKIIVFKKKRRKNYMRKQGHRQLLTELLIKDVRGGGAGSDGS